MFKKAHWMVPEHLHELNFQNANRFSELMIHKPHEGFFVWFLVVLLYPLVNILYTFMLHLLKLVFVKHQLIYILWQHFVVVHYAYIDTCETHKFEKPAMTQTHFDVLPKPTIPPISLPLYLYCQYFRCLHFQI